MGESKLKDAARKFSVGDRVTMSNSAIAAGLNGRFDRRDGVVVRLCNWPENIVVLRDGRQQPEYYHMGFWVNCERGDSIDGR